ncbi:MAG: hypothetical protein Tsb0019_03270 [Roseibium sp.]
MTFRKIGVFAILLMAALFGQETSEAAVVNYSYTGEEDGACAVEGIGYTTCSVTGTFSLNSALFGQQQQTVSGAMTLHIAGTAVFTFNLFHDPNIGQIDECTEVCNQVITNASGLVTYFDFFAVPTYTFGDIVSFRSTGWSWEGFVNGDFGIYASGASAVISKAAQVVPLPASFLMLVSALAAIGLGAGRKYLE